MDIDNDSLLYRIASYDERIGLCSILFHVGHGLGYVTFGMLQICYV